VRIVPAEVVAFTAEVATLAAVSTTEVAAATVASTMEDIVRLLGCSIFEASSPMKSAMTSVHLYKSSYHSHQTNHRI
jgi:hypothetical protein